MADKTLRLKDQGDAVFSLQRLLTAQGFPVNDDGDFGGGTNTAVKAFQKARGLDADGIVGKDTWDALRVPKITAALSRTSTPGRLTQADIDDAAKTLGAEPRAVATVNKVESPKGGFLPDGRPTILFERHWMRKQMLAKGQSTADAEKRYPNIVNASTGGYLGDEAEYDRLAIAKTLDEASALEACSWGAYQIMGYHWKLLGYASVQDMVADMSRSEQGQLAAFVRFIQSQPALLKAIRAKDFVTFARYYNGVGAVAKYSKKMQDCYDSLA
jgi:ribosomal protein S9